jgi:hypothetical protein
MCVLVAMPLVATLSSPGLAFASEMRSGIDLAGTPGWTITMCGSVTAWVIGEKLRTGSNGMFLWSAGLMVKEAATVSRVWPSGSALAARSEPIRLPAPGRLSTTMFWPSASPTCRAISRAMRSVDPPGLCGTIRRIGRLGYCCAPTGVAVASNAAPSNTNDE